METKRPRRKPILSNPVRFNLRLEKALAVRVKAYAASRGLDASKAGRDLLALGLNAADQALATFNRSLGEKNS